MDYYGEIRRFPYAPPPDWMACDGQLLQVSQYPTLYALLGNTYGGESGKTFGLPDLRGRVAVGQGGTAGSMGANGMGGGASRRYQTVVYAIAARGDFASLSPA